MSNNEKYKVIILAAGCSRRLSGMTEDKPKSFLEINDKKIIEHTLDHLNDRGIKDVTIIVGYLREKFFNQIGEKYKDLNIDYVISEDYARTGNSLSIFLSKESWEKEKKHVLLLEADNFYNPVLLDKVIENEKDNVVLSNNSYVMNPEKREDIVLKGKDEIIFSIEKGLSHEDELCLGELMGICKLSPRFMEEFYNYLQYFLQNFGDNHNYEKILGNFAGTNGNELFSLDRENDYWININREEDYIKAKEIGDEYKKSGEEKTNSPKLLLIEGSTELEAGIPPNLAILVASVKNAGYNVKVFSTNDYKQGGATGDSRRVESLQVPPTNPSEMLYKVKEADIKEDFLKLVKEYKPDVVGLSSTEATYTLGRNLLKLIKDRKDILKIVGGAHPTLVPEEVIAEEFVDVICVGEGEKALVELLDAIKDKKIMMNCLNHIPQNLEIDNLWFKQSQSGEIIKNPTKLANVDDAPFQDWSAWPVPPRASKTMRGKVSKTALVELTRGCPHRCTYCANIFFNEKFKEKDPETGKVKLFYRERSIDKFIEEINYLREKYGIEYVYIGDETIMTTGEDRFKEFIEKYPLTSPDGNITKKGLPFWCETRPESITYDKVKAFLSVGMSAINIGIESGNEEFRRNVLHRQVSNDQMIQGIYEGVKAGARIGSNVIIGFPGETRDMIFDSIKLMRQAKAYVAKNIGEIEAEEKLSVMIHLFQPYRKTALREDAIKRGIIKPDHICGDYRIDALGTGEISSDELLGLQRTFNLYVDLPKEKWDEIKIAEKFDGEGDAKFKELGKEYQLKHFGKTSF